MRRTALPELRLDPPRIRSFLAKGRVLSERRDNACPVRNNTSFTKFAKQIALTTVSPHIVGLTSQPKQQHNDAPNTPCGNSYPPAHIHLLRRRLASLPRPRWNLHDQDIRADEMERLRKPGLEDATAGSRFVQSDRLGRSRFRDVLLRIRSQFGRLRRYQKTRVAPCLCRSLQRKSPVEQVDTRGIA